VGTGWIRWGTGATVGQSLMRNFGGVIVVKSWIRTKLMEIVGLLKLRKKRKIKYYGDF
jgi:hypothetical protein